MRQARIIFPVALLVAAFIAIAGLLWDNASAQDRGKEKPTAPLVKWEYKVVNAGGGRGGMDLKTMEEKLNKLGNDGWECVGTISDVQGGDSRRPDPNWTQGVLILRRPKQS